MRIMSRGDFVRFLLLLPNARIEESSAKLHRGAQLAEPL